MPILNEAFLNKEHGDAQTRLAVSEIFGPTFQGEGPSLGRRCLFLRLGGCNLHCVWCDTAYTWRYSERHPHVTDKVYDPKTEVQMLGIEPTMRALHDLDPQREGGLLVISGGEPLLQQYALYRLILAMSMRLYDDEEGGPWNPFTRYEIETNGTILPVLHHEVPIAHYNVSPKLNHSGNDFTKAIIPDTLRAYVLSGRATFKFVVQYPAQLEAVARYVHLMGADPNDVYIMPEGTTAAQILERGQALAEEVLRWRFHLTTRLHVLLWGDQRAK